MRRPPHPSAPRLTYGRAFLVLLTGLALALSAAFPHDMAAEQAGNLVRAEIAVNAVHPGSPAHFEASDIQIHPPCLACLLQLQTGTVLGRPSASPPPLRTGDRFAALTEQAPAQKPSRVGPARAPPASSPVG
ncbi:MAG: hypothetical protein ACJ75H_13730 [Thermoanaerobaculia bacterium]